MKLAGRYYLKTSAARTSKHSDFTSGTTGAVPHPTSNYSGPAITAFATAGEGDTAGETAVFLSFWSNGRGPPNFAANCTVTLTVNGHTSSDGGGDLSDQDGGSDRVSDR